MAKKFTPDYFIKKFSAIPEDQFCTDVFQNGSRKCAIGHCGEPKHAATMEAVALSELFFGQTTRINDGLDLRYSQESVKGRILAALKDAKAGKFVAHNHAFRGLNLA